MNVQWESSIGTTTADSTAVLERPDLVSQDSSDSSSRTITPTSRLETPSLSVSRIPILWRVTSSTLNSNAPSGDLNPRDPSAPASYAQAVLHINPRNRTPTGFISFYSTYQSALNKHKRLLRRGHHGIQLLAVLTEGLDAVYDGYAVASREGYHDRPMQDSCIDSVNRSNGGSGDPRGLASHMDEVLAHGSIPASRIIAVFPGDGEGKYVSLYTPVVADRLLHFQCTIPGDFAESAWPTPMMKLREEVRQRTGSDDEKPFKLLIRSMGDCFLTLYMLERLADRIHYKYVWQS